YSDTRRDIIADGIDVAFRIGELPDSSLKARHLFVLPRQVVASRELLSHYPTITHPDDLAKLPWIGLNMRQNNREFRHKNGEVAVVTYTPTVYVDNVTGKYFYHMERMTANPQADDVALQDRLINICTEISGIALPE
ncbi:LysR substrate-binding domain-containing protein, partial [Enterobacter asburiae]|uniref:LysR substrate-binding domain-containing protein n=1 Tax=Enterobacter asburiae TaxID=61645 RepID=UPI0034E19F03